MKSRVVLLALILPLFFACKTKQYSRNNKQIEKAANKANPNMPSYTTLNYIESFKAVAIEEMNAFGIPASITLAQGIIESGSGNSSLAKFANNHFGIKCTSEWKGKAYYKDDDKSDDCFRVYKDARESYKDHSQFLKRKRYSFLFELDKNDYKNWAYGLKQAGYATNPKYPTMLINIIERYQLNQYDQSETEREKLKREDKVFTEINAGITEEKKKFTPVATPPSKQVIKTPLDTSGTVPSGPGSVDPPGPDKSYTVQKGDTLYNLSKRFNISIEDIKTLNSLSEEGIKIGQKLILVK